VVERKKAQIEKGKGKQLMEGAPVDVRIMLNIFVPVHSSMYVT
jgi:hypothetical protein